LTALEGTRPRFGILILTWGLVTGAPTRERPGSQAGSGRFPWERVTGIEPALSAWESTDFTRNMHRDQHFRGSASDRETPLITVANGTLMAGRGSRFACATCMPRLALEAISAGAARVVADVWQAQHCVCNLRGVTASSRPGLWRPRYWAYGPITDARPADRHKIAGLIQRGRAVTDERLLAQALTYARFRARFCGGLGLFYLVVAAVGAVGAALGSSTLARIGNAGLGGVFLLNGIVWLWQADRCRRGARATAQARRQAVLAEVARMLRCLTERPGQR
jgi:hypothetical protein